MPIRRHIPSAPWPAAVCVLAGVLLATGSFPRAAQPQQESGRAQPRLLVILVVDQMRGDYVSRFGDSWTGGLHRLLTDGAVFTNAAYPSIYTWTCAGHATISTGTHPAVHGMVQNLWWDRRLGRSVGCVEDPESPLVSYGAPAKGGASAHRLLAPTLADELRARHPGARTVALSLKDRSAIVLGGRRAELALWFDTGVNAWMTSSAYTTRLLPPIAKFIEQHPIAESLGAVWTRRLEPSRYLTPDQGFGEAPSQGWTARFPHPLDDGDHQVDAAFFSRWEGSPSSDAYLERMAEAAVDAFSLGRRQTPDLLAVSFSALDLVGHSFGPDSQEVQDLLAHLDDTVGRLLGFLDDRVGRGNYVVALSADHGIQSIPEQAVAAGRDAGRVSTAAAVAAVDRALEASVGPGPSVARMMSPDVYFLPARAAAILGNPAAVTAARAALLSVPGITRVILPAELEHPGSDPLLQAASLGYVAGRSGDLVVVSRPGWVFGTPRPAANHGGASPDDRRVPLVVMGGPLVPGTYPQAVTPADLAPTLASLAGVTMSRAQGRVLAESIGR